MLFHDITQLASSLNSLAFQYNERVPPPQSALTTLTADIKRWILKGELSLPAGRVENCKWLVLAQARAGEEVCRRVSQVRRKFPCRYDSDRELEGKTFCFSNWNSRSSSRWKAVNMTFGGRSCSPFLYLSAVFFNASGLKMISALFLGPGSTYFKNNCIFTPLVTQF